MIGSDTTDGYPSHLKGLTDTASLQSALTTAGLDKATATLAADNYTQGGVNATVAWTNIHSDTCVTCPTLELAHVVANTGCNAQRCAPSCRLPRRAVVLLARLCFDAMRATGGSRRRVLAALYTGTPATTSPCTCTASRASVATRPRISGVHQTTRCALHAGPRGFTALPTSQASQAHWYVYCWL